LGWKHFGFYPEVAGPRIKKRGLTAGAILEAITETQLSGPGLIAAPVRIS